jgi:hypothetical protein
MIEKLSNDNISRLVPLYAKLSSKLKLSGNLLLYYNKFQQNSRN